MRALLGLLLFAPVLVAAPKRLELGFPQLKERVQIVFPENYDQRRKWPAIFYYHGTGGKPTTELIQAHTGDQTWFVVGMTYTKGGNIPATPEYIDEEFQIFNAARRHLATKWSLDPKRCYVAGFSKGGWMSGFLLQHDPSIAGAIILGAGHNFLIRKPARFRTPKPLFVGIGRKDGNYPFALRALVHYRPLGAQATIDTWPGLGHSFPTTGSPALRQWLTIEADPKADHKSAAAAWVHNRIDEIKGLPDPVDQWVAFRMLEATPYLRVLADKGKTQVQGYISRLEQGARVAAEAKALAAHRNLLRKEVKGHSLELCQKLAGDYLELSETYQGTRQAEVALADHQRINKLALHIKEQRKIAAEQKKAFPAAGDEDADPFPKPPSRTPRIPRNPLIR